MDRKLKTGAKSLYQRMVKETVPCPICSSKRLRRLADYDRYGMGLVTVMCDRCGFIFTNPRPVGKAMVEFYETTYREFYSGTTDLAQAYDDNSKTYRRAQRLYAFAVEELAKLDPASPAVLDAGCEVGVLLNIFRNRMPQSRLYGVEPSASAEYAGIKNNALVFKKDIQTFCLEETSLAGKLNLIILNHVLEHLLDPVDNLSRLRDFLDPAGLFLVEVPNVLSSYWESHPLQMFHLAHVNHFSPTTLKMAFALSGLKVVKESAGSGMAITYLCRKNDGILPRQLTLPSRQDKQAVYRCVYLRTRTTIRLMKLEDFCLKHPLPLLVKATLQNYYRHGVWKTLVKIAKRLLHEVMQRTYHVQYFIAHPFMLRRRKNSYPLLENEIKGKRVLIVGSGPSAMELGPIPQDVLVWTCNRGLKFFEERNWNGPVHLYMCTAGKMQRMAEIEELLLKIKTQLLVVDDLRYVRKRGKFKDTYASLIQDDGKHNDYLKTLIFPRTIRDIRGRSYHPWTSTGIRLLQYALFFGAKEIYLAGIDFGNHGYFWGKNEDRWFHNDIDKKFLQAVVEKYPHIYTTSKSSPASTLIPNKPIEKAASFAGQMNGHSQEALGS